MQAKAQSTIPPKSIVPPPVKIPSISQVSLPANYNNVPQAISIAAPSHEVLSPPRREDENQLVLDDEKTVAFWDYQFLFVSQRSETSHPITLRIVEGAIPQDFPLGTYYLTGPGLFTDDHGSSVHPLDGHGYLRTFKIDGAKGKVEFMARYIQTEAQVEERDPVTGQWRFTHRGPFSVLKGGKMVGNTKVMKNVANTSVLRWGGRLFCLWEGGDPYEIESATLDTLGKFDIVTKAQQPEMMVEDDDAGLKVDMWDVAAQILKPILYGKYGIKF